MSSGIYVNHRENQREWILEVAQSLFLENGIDKVTISQITKAARLTRATLYNYFTSKEELAHEVFKIVTKGWVTRNLAEVWNIPGTGFESIERFVNSHFTYLADNLEEARFVAEFNHLYAKSWAVDVILQLLEETLAEEKARLLNAVLLGQQDGSVRTDMAPEMLVISIFNFNSGMTGRLGEFGTKLEVEYDLTVQTIFGNVCRVFLDGLKA